jgi:hypothetical protein
MMAKPCSPDRRPTPQKASRAPRRKTNQAQERRDAVTCGPGARECDPAGPAARLHNSITVGRLAVPAGCPLSPDIHLVLDLSENLNQAMRQLRRKLDACEKCPLDLDCGFRQVFQERVKAAIQAVNEEWARLP